MKTLILTILFFWLLPVLPACDKAIPYYPITKNGDLVCVIVQPEDQFFIFLTERSCGIQVSRPLSEGSVIEFDKTYYDEVNFIQVIRWPETNGDR